MPHTSTSNFTPDLLSKVSFNQKSRGGGGGGGATAPLAPLLPMPIIMIQLFFLISCSEYYGLLKCPLLLLHSACMYNNVYDTQVNERYRNQLCVPSDAVAVFEEDGGLLMASKAVAAYQV